MALDQLQTYDVLIIDEAQDLLLAPFVEVFEALLKGGLQEGHWMIFLDAYQDLFEAISPIGLRRLLDLNPAQFRLTVNCRNTKPIAVAVQILSGVEWEETLHVSGPKVEQHYYQDAAHQRREVSNCINRWLSDGIKPWQMVVLSDRMLRESDLRGGLVGVPYPLVDLGDEPLGEKKINFCSIRDYKGLEADVVAVVDIDDLDSRAGLLSVYVGASRARVGLAVFLAKSVVSAYTSLAADYGERIRGRVATDMKLSSPDRAN